MARAARAALPRATIAMTTIGAAMTGAAAAADPIATSDPHPASHLPHQRNAPNDRAPRSVVCFSRCALHGDQPWFRCPNISSPSRSRMPMPDSSTPCLLTPIALSTPPLLCRDSQHDLPSGSR